MYFPVYLSAIINVQVLHLKLLNFLVIKLFQ